MVEYNHQLWQVNQECHPLMITIRVDTDHKQGIISGPICQQPLDRGDVPETLYRLNLDR